MSKACLFVFIFLISPVSLARAKEAAVSPTVFQEALSAVRDQYVEPLPEKKFAAKNLKELLNALDPYSALLDREEYEALQGDAAGRFGGIGIEVGVRDGSLQVIAPSEGGPAARAGIRPGDRILKIDGFQADKMGPLEAVRKMRGPASTSVKLEVLREGAARSEDIAIRREVVEVESVKEARFLEEGIGYVRFSSFQEKSADELDRALEDLGSQGMSSLVLDLRNNSGGLLAATVEVCERFVPQGALIVSLRGRGPEVRYFSSKKPQPLKALAVLVNRGSASGSEILAGAVQDHRLGVVLGSRTYGKGSLQTVIPLSDGSALKLTTARYFTPAGRPIEASGITPDVAAAPSMEKDDLLQKALEWVRQNRA